MLTIALNTAIGLSLIGILYQCASFIKKNRSFPGKKWAANGLNFKAFFSNTIFQAKLFKAGKLRWFIHFMVISGFAYLVIFHALDDVTSFGWFPYYQPTVDPFQFLRNLAGFFVLAGCAGFLYRRIFFFQTLKKRKIQFKGLFFNNPVDPAGDFIGFSA